LVPIERGIARYIRSQIKGVGGTRFGSFRIKGNGLQAGSPSVIVECSQKGTGQFVMNLARAERCKTPLRRPLLALYARRHRDRVTHAWLERPFGDEANGVLLRVGVLGIGRLCRRRQPNLDLTLVLARQMGDYILDACPSR